MRVERSERAKAQGRKPEAGSIKAFLWLTMANVTFSITRQQKSKMDPFVATLLGFGSDRQRSALFSLSKTSTGASRLLRDDTRRIKIEI